MALRSVQLLVRVASPLTNVYCCTNRPYLLSFPTRRSSDLASVGTTVTSAPLLTITKSAAPSPVSPGATLTFTLAYAYAVTSYVNFMLLSYPAPANTTFVSATGGGTLSGSVVSWAVGGLAAGASGSVQL